MAAQGRKNVHGKAGVRFKAPYTASKNKSMLRNVVTDLIIYDEVKVTSGVTKELKTLADHMPPGRRPLKLRPAKNRR